MTEDLWGEIESVQTARTPRSIIAEQGKILEEKTHGRLQGRVRMRETREDRNLHSFFIHAPLLSYHFELFRFAYDPAAPYPVAISDGRLDRKYECEDQETLVDTLRDLLGSDDTKRVISNLLAQVDEV